MVGYLIYIKMKHKNHMSQMTYKAYISIYQYEFKEKTLTKVVCKQLAGFGRPATTSGLALDGQRFQIQGSSARIHIRN